MSAYSCCDRYDEHAEDCISIRYKALLCERDSLREELKSSREQFGPSAYRMVEEHMRFKEVIQKSAKALDSIKFELNQSVYTLEDDQFETTFYVRDILQEALSDPRFEESEK